MTHQVINWTQVQEGLPPNRNERPVWTTMGFFSGRYVSPKDVQGNGRLGPSGWFLGGRPGGTGTLVQVTHWGPEVDAPVEAQDEGAFYDGL